MSETPTATPTLEEKRLRLEALLRKKAAAPKTYPTSFLQQRLWFLDLLEPGSPVYNVSSAIRMLGPLDHAAFDRALNEVARRHEALRTGIRVQNGEPVQVVEPEASLRIETEDISAWAEGDEREAELNRRLRDLSCAPFDLARAPLFRARLYRESDDSHVLGMVVHHMISDGWSLGVLGREMNALYEAFRTGRPSPLPPLELHYGDFARWQREQYDGGALAGQLAFWKETLAGVPAAIELPFDRPRPPVQDYAGGKIYVEFGADMVAGIHALGRAQGATTFMVLLAAFSALLHRYTGDTDVVVGTPIAGRTRPELEAVFGYFANTLALRSDLAGDPGFLELLGRVRATLLGAYANQDFPFEKLVDELKVERSTAYNPLFQVLFVLQNAPSERAEIKDVSVQGMSVPTTTAMFDLMWQMFEGEPGIMVQIEYRTGLFDQDTVLRMARHFRNLLRAALADPHARVSTLPLLEEDEADRVLREWNDTAAALPSPGTEVVPHLFAAQAARTPDAVAVRFAGDALTYAQVDARSDRLARRLRALGVGPETRVGVCLGRGIDTPVAVLAVLKAGGCYVAMDPAYPADRLAYMLADSRAAVLVTSAGIAAALPEHGAVVVPVDEMDKVVASGPSVDSSEAEAPHACPALPDNPAYLLYTSGSTGRPKGVLLPHRALVNLVHWQLARWGGDAPAVTLQFASLSFDVSFQEIFATWAAGGTLVMVDEDTRRDGQALLAYAREQGVERLFLPFAALDALAEVADAPALRGLRLREIVTAGEQLQGTPALRRLARATGATVDNQYGPSEAHVVSAHRLEADPREWPLLPPIGAPIANTRLYVLDGNLRPVPQGVAGELLIGGDCLARGYHGRPGLTAEKFVPDPVSGAPGARLYRTGDRARWLGDGTIQYLGRMDHQVKVRGFRVELGEIEAVLHQHAQVAEAVVAVREDRPGDRRIVAYVVPRAATAVDAVALRAWLLERLPEHMVPSAFKAMEALPLLPNGKVDRRSLPAPEDAGGHKQHVAPRTDTERRVAEIWTDCLGAPRVGVDDNFFALGGHSLIATKVATRIRRAFDVEMPLRLLFEAQTLGELAARVDGLRGADAAAALAPVPRDRALPLSFAQQRLWFVERMVPGTATYNLPAPIALRDADPAVVERTLAELVARHETLRTTFAEEDGSPVQVVHPPSAVTVPVEDLRNVPEEERHALLDRRMVQELERPFDLERGPLLRALLVRASDRSWMLFLTLHHIITDGWSMDVLRREFGAVSAAFAAGGPSPLPPLPLQYGDFAVWQRRWLTGSVLDEQVAFWKQRLAGIPEALALPTDLPRPAVQSFAGRTVTRALPRELVGRLNTLSRTQGSTLFMTMLAGFSALLGRWAGQTDVVVGSPIAGRNRPETEGLIGFFVNSLVMRTDLSGNPTFRELLGRVREGTLQAYGHQDLPFERLVDELQVPRSSSHTPIFQVVLNLLTQRGGTAPAEPKEDDEPAKYDLNLSIADQGADIVASLNYSTALFHGGTIRRMLDQLVALLEQVTADPDLRLDEVELLSPAERALVLAEWNDTAVAYPRESSIATLFAEQAAATPDAVALSTADGAALTYAELDARSNRLARHLRSRGVVRGTRVGLSVPRSPELIVALLAIVKTGAAYVPLDPSYPADRLTYMLGDAGVTHLVVHSAVPDALGGFAGETVRLADEAEAIAQQSADAVEDEATGEDLCYVIYTSGSTGRPKGVAVPHRGVSRLVKGGGFADFGAEQVFLQLAPIAFDASTFEVWGPLLNGARLVLFPPETPSLEELGRFVEAKGITTLWLTAGLFHQMVDGQLHHLRGVRQLLAGGDALSVAHVRRAAAELRGTRLINGYGPTESTTFTCCHAVDAGDAERGSVSIGRPIGNTRVYVLDERLRPAPVGVAGELCIAGDGLAHGYLNQPAATAEKLIPDPFSAAPGGRLYRSGDRARWLPDGTVEFLGRLDGQVKIRGYRIETGEVEAALTSHPAVKDAAVVAREDVPGDRRLVAYVIARAGQTADAAELAAHLRGRLPEHMVPAAYVSLDALPLTANGKVDRRALPAPEASASAGQHVAPSTDTETALAEIWAACLGVERVGVHDNFFALGGHSLIATRVASAIRERMRVELPLRALFEAQTVAQLAERVEAERKPDAPQAPPLVPVPRTTPPPASFAQARLWFVERMVPGTPTYNVPTPLPLPGSIDAAVLERTLGEIVRRHEALRTTFAAVDGEPVQVIHPPAPFRLDVVDLTAVPEAERGSAVGRLVGEESLRPFDLEAGPLFRATLYRITADEALLLPVMHHVVSDGWSCDVLMRELNVLYTAFAADRPSPLPELPIQYADFAVWQRAWLRGDELDRQAAYWKQALAGIPEALELPTDRPRPAVQTFRGRSVARPLPRPLVRRIKALGGEEGVTLFMTLLAGFSVVLGRWSGQSDVVIGSPIAGRTRAETEGLIGFFVNNLVMRTDLSDAPTFRGLLGRVRDATLGAFAHQDMPFERLVDALDVPRSTSHSPIFQVLFNLLTPAGMAAAADAGMPDEVTESDEPAKYDLSLTVADLGADVGASLNFNIDLFDSATIHRMMGHLVSLLEQVTANPDLPIADVDLLPAGERTRVVEQWNETARPYPTGLRIHDLFEAQVAAMPHAPALAFAGSVLTYAELNARANRLAHHLAALGVGPEARVGVAMERTPDLIVALLAVLKAGGAYVPVDPAYPADRIAYMLEDSGAAVVLTQSRVAATLPATAARIVAVDADAEAIAAQPDANPQATSTPQNAAYAIYTSGSTGRPKGVVIEHRSTVTVLQWLKETVTDEERSSSLGSTSISFDVSIAEIFGTLCWGGTLVLVENALSLAELGEDAGIKLAAMVPSAAQELLRMGGIPSTVRSLNLGGEPLPNALAQALYRTGTVDKVLNLYGPTEDTTYSTWSLVEKGGAKVYVGRPVANTQSYILDANLRPVPIGVPGELYLAGDGLSRGYLNRPGMTAERYIPNPFGPAGSRMYRVGDLTRYLADGTIEYLGRLDHQVKIRGFRIEIGEIEAALAAHASVKDAAVVAREGADGDRRLVAYVVAEANALADVAELRMHLKQRLPEYMVPGAFVVMDALPLTPNGKVDRRALPAPEQAADEDTYAAPRTPTEEALAEIWRDVLGAERIGRHDGFFTLGGHSLLATRVVSRIRQTLAVDLPLRAVFEAPTLEELAHRVDAERGTGAEVDAPMVRADRSRPLPLSFAQERLWFVDRLIPGSSAYNIPVVLPVPGIDAQVLEQVLAELVRRHESLRTTFASAGGTAVQVVHPAGGFRLHAVHATPDTAGPIIAEESNRPFHLEHGPLFRASLVHIAEAGESHEGRDYPLPLAGEGGEPQASRVRAPATTILVLVMHHIVSDGWSMDVLTAEVNALYAAFAAGRPSPLPEPALQYADFAVWQRAWMTDAVVARQAAYWKRQLGGAPALLELPTDRPRPPVQSFRGATVPVAVRRQTADALNAMAREEGATLFMVLLAAFNVLLGRYADQDDVVVGSPIAGRNRAETEGMIGFFVNNLVLRTDLSGEPGFRALVQRVKEVTLGAYAHQDLPFERLVEELNVDRSLAHAPLFQVMFALQNTGTTAAGMGAAGDDGPAPESADAGSTQATAKFDLTLNLTETPHGLLGSLEYSTDLFDDATARRMAQHYAALLDSIAAAGADAPIARLPMFTPGEREQVLVGWNRTGAGYDRDLCVHEVVERRALQTPDAPALAFAGQALTYGEMEARANRLARHLRRHGVGPEVPVAISVDRSLDMVVAMLGVMKAGGAYLPVDPAYPRERRTYMLEDSGAPVVITQAHLADDVPPTGAELVRIDADWPEIERESAEPPAPLAGPDNIAYVIYTSGSTGRPKGVMVPHRGVVSLTDTAAELWHLRPTDRVQQFASFSFDAAVWEILTTLRGGACLYLATQAELMPGAPLVETLTRNGITIALLSPSVLAVMPEDAHLPAVRTLISGGEALSASVLQRWRRRPQGSADG